MAGAADAGLRQQGRVAAKLTRPEPARLLRVGRNAAQVPTVCAEAEDCSRTESDAGGNMERPAT